ncbi:uncharacterized [Tachysurus ichikawai]
MGFKEASSNTEHEYTPSSCVTNPFIREININFGRRRSSVSVSECKKARDTANDRAVLYRPPPTARDRNLLPTRSIERRKDRGRLLLMDCICSDRITLLCYSV